MSASNNSQVPRKLKRGEVLFNEGDPSKSMYFVQGGTIRLFKRKGGSSIELGMIHKGEVIGEMGFLDGGPRSASAEAIHDTDLVEITGTGLADQMKGLPAWLMVLLKTVVNRLRSANNKIRQLENSSTAYTYGATGGVSTTYQFLSVYDVLKVCTALLVVSSRNAEAGPNGSVKCGMPKINKYANQIMGIHSNKITEMLDILERAEMATIDRASLDKIVVTVKDVDHLDILISFLNEENLKEHTKKLNFSYKAVVLMSFMVKHLDLFPSNNEGVSAINLARIIELEKPNNNGKSPFSVEEVNELVKAKLATEVQLKDNDTMLTNVNTKGIIRMYRIQKVMKEVEALNEKRREQAAKGAKLGK